jgi:hypothetical protein
MTGAGVCDFESAAYSDSGYAIVAFAVAAPGATCLVYAAVRTPGNDHFEAPVQLSATRSQSPQVAVDSEGNALIAWSEPDSRRLQVARYLPREGGFQPAQSLAIDDQKPGLAYGPLLLRVSEPTGAAIIAFPSLDGVSQKRPAAAIGTTRAGFGRARLLAGPGSSFNNTRDRRFDAAAGADGTLAVVWRGGERQSRRVKIARVGPGAESITRLDTNTISDLHAAEVSVSIADGGRVTVAWSRLSAHGKRHVVEASTCAPSKHCGKPQVLSPNGAQYGAHPEAATSSTGTQYVAWLTQSGVEWARAPKRTGRFGRARRLARAAGSELHLYRGRRGAMLATVRQQQGSATATTSLFTYGEL